MPRTQPCVTQTFVNCGMGSSVCIAHRNLKTFARNLCPRLLSIVSPMEGFTDERSKAGRARSQLRGMSQESVTCEERNMAA